ncbi:TlpA family protein disulfide reductase [Chitinophaga sp. NPDC101104]|uniref:TlpA family protein disulfide reductase n=1 Tax=Chitinophaga sp. NPDC101104 TaxID=3390561 RepID=UPI003D05FAA8
MSTLKSAAWLLLLLATGFESYAGMIVKGVWERRHEGKISLYRIEHGRLIEISTSVPDGGNRFGFYFEPKEEGFFVIGIDPAASQLSKYTFYAKKNDQLDITVNDSTFVLNGKSSKENAEIARWHDFVQPVEWKAVYFNRARSIYSDFFPLLEEKAKAAAAYRAGKTGNKTFDAVFEQFRRYEMQRLALIFLSTPRTAHPKTSDLSTFYKNMRLADWSADAGILRFPFAPNVMMATARTEARLKGDDNFELVKLIPLVTNDTLKGEVVLESENMLRSYLGFQESDKKYGQYIVTADQKLRRTAITEKLAKAAAKSGAPAINFSYPDVTGKMTSLSDFKGKVVLVDVWATWCGPCKAELPALKQLEQELHGPDIVFMGVSVDVEKDKQKWLDFVKTENLKGVQLFASGWSEIAKYYEIKGIPRFMVFDKQGNIVSTDAPRPSSPELKLLLQNEMKK